VICRFGRANEARVQEFQHIPVRGTACIRSQNSSCSIRRTATESPILKSRGTLVDIRPNVFGAHAILTNLAPRSGGPGAPAVDVGSLALQADRRGAPEARRVARARRCVDSGLTATCGSTAR
jgi:hypothetical protein